MPNINELDLTLRDIEANPERHRQGWWASKIRDDGAAICGTGMCAAGFTVVRHGYKLIFNVDLASTCKSPDGDIEYISDVAQRILELDEGQAEEFFCAYNSLPRLQRLRDLFARKV